MKRLILGVVAFLFILSFVDCGKSGGGGAMAFSSDNIKELMQKMNDVSKSMDPNMERIDAVKTLSKGILMIWVTH